MPKERSLNLYNYKTFLLYNFLFLRKVILLLLLLKRPKKIDINDLLALFQLRVTSHFCLIDFYCKLIFTSTNSKYTSQYSTSLCR